jgi:PAS domain S-box-containing protein
MFFDYASGEVFNVATKKRAHQKRQLATVDLGIEGLRVPIHSHIAYLWESEQDFAAAVGFVEAGLRGSDYCVVIPDQLDVADILANLENRGIDVEDFKVRKRLSFIERSPWAEVMLKKISATFEAALAAGAPVVRLIGNVGWGREGEATDSELLVYEARLTEIAERFPAVIVCLHQVYSLTGMIFRHGVLGTHPQILEAGGVLGNPYFVPLDRFLAKIGAITSGIADRQRDREALRYQAEILQTIFDNIPVMISIYDAAGRLVLVNREWERILGWSLEEARRIDVLAEAYPEPVRHREVREFIRQAERRWADFRTRTRDGDVIETSWARVAVSDGTRIGFGQDITERKRAEVALQQSYEELRALSAQLREVREAESTRIARLVHDEVGQMLTALGMDVAWLDEKLQAYPPTVREELSGKLRSMSQLLGTTMDAVQRIVTELRPSVLDKLGLEAAFEWYVGEFQKRTGIACRLHTSLGDTIPDPDRSTALFRILQEALTNVVRHAGASAVEIRLAADAGRILLEVADNGRGIPEDRAADSRSLGLLGMRERARSLGGEITVRRIPGDGTTVEVTLPP